MVVTDGNNETNLEKGVRSGPTTDFGSREEKSRAARFGVTGSVFFESVVAFHRKAS